MPDNGFKKESALARQGMPLEALIVARARARQRLSVMEKSASRIGLREADLNRVRESIKDYDDRIHRREAALEKRGSLSYT